MGEAGGGSTHTRPFLSPTSPRRAHPAGPPRSPGSPPPSTTCLKLTRFQPLGRKKSVSYTNRSGYLQIIANVKYSGVMTKCRDCQGLRGGGCWRGSRDTSRLQGEGEGAADRSCTRPASPGRPLRRRAGSVPRPHSSLAPRDRARADTAGDGCSPAPPPPGAGTNPRQDAHARGARVSQTGGPVAPVT